MNGNRRNSRKRWVDPDDAPEFTGKALEHPKGVWKVNERTVSTSEGKAAMSAALHGKSRINIHLDNDLIAHYRTQAGDRGYQTLINAALRRDMESEGLKQTVAETIKTEIAKHLRNTEISQKNDTLSLGKAYAMTEPLVFKSNEKPRSPTRPITQANSGTPIFGPSSKTQGTA